MSSSREFRNAILNGVPPAARDFIASQLEPVNLRAGQNLEKPNQQIDHVYFLETGLLSVMCGPAASAPLEVAMIGRDGMTGLSLLFGTAAPYTCFVQMDGLAHRLPGAAMLQVWNDAEGVREPILNYAGRFLRQLAETAYANGRCLISERLARRLLIAQQLGGEDNIPLTHDLMSVMLSVRRSSITVALQQLQSNKAIRLERSLVVITDRDELMALAGRAHFV
jgi:CRP-like cAMP-binding protein